ncbi:MAG: glycosyltransferase family 4 protein [Rubellimicrobium sp.]|nr:glycosyltransferase family 4 protein [Rubellimicrobium sp.]
MSSWPKLGYLVPRFPGQTQTAIWCEIAALEERGVAVSLVSTQPPDPALMPHVWGQAALERTFWLGSGGAAPAALAALGALPLGHMIRGERGLPRAVLRAMAPARRLVRRARAEGFHHIHVHGAGEGALIAALARRMGGPTWSIHLPGPLSDYGPGQEFKWQGARFATVATARILNEIRFVLRESLPARVTVRPPGVDTAFFRREGPLVPGRPGQPLRLFACGELAPAKGFDDLLRAVQILREGGHDARLTIAGEDAQGGSGHRRALEARIAELQLGPHVTLAGATDAAQVREGLLSAQVFVLSSWHEPLGTALMEAMACGVPSVATAAGGVRELVEDGREALLVQPRAPAHLAEAILRIHTNPELARRLSTLARARIEAGFDAGQVAEHLMREAGYLPLDHEGDLIPAPPAQGWRRDRR